MVRFRPKILARIETHFNSTQSTEAWILLSMVASKITSRNPERVVSELLKNLKEGTVSNFFNSTTVTSTRNMSFHQEHTDNPYMQLEVLACWLNDLNAATLNDVFDIMNSLLESGSVVPRHVQRVFEICWRISLRNGPDEPAKWALRVADRCKLYLQKHSRTLVIANLCNAQLISYIYVYAETLVDTSATVDADIMQFFDTFLQSVISRKIRRMFGIRFVNALK